MPSASSGLRHPASASCLGRHSRLPGCGTQHPLRALGGTRVLLAAAPTTPPCFRHWRRSSSLQRKNYFNFRDSGASADAPLSHFHGWGRNGKRHLQRLLPAEAAALRGIPSYTTQQGRPASTAQRAALAVSGGALWARAGSGIAVSAMLSARTMLMSRFCIRFSPSQAPSKPSAFVVPSVPRFARFGRFWARIAPQMR